MTNPAARPRAAEGADDARISGLRLGVEQERRLRAWPADRIRPKSIALGVRSLLAEVDALRAERDQSRRDLAAAAVEHELLRRHLPAIVAYWDRYARAGFPISAEAVAFSDAVQAMRDLLAAPPSTRGGAILEAADAMADMLHGMRNCRDHPHVGGARGRADEAGA